jgi:hypothetical protein
MFGYKCFYKDKTCEVYALRSFDAQEKAAKIFKAKKSYEVTVMLCEKQTNGTTEQVVHTATF